MKTNKLFKTVLLLLLAAAGTNAAWADGTINIPQNLGNYILIGNASTNPKTTATGITLTGCQVDGSAESSYTVGSTSGSTVRMEFALTAEAGNYLFSFKSGAQDASTVSLSLTNSSSEVVWSKASESIEDTDSWDLTKSHNFVIGDLAAGNYTMTITGVSKTGSYYGNFGNFCFHKSAQYADNWNNTSNIIFTDAENKGNSISNDWINGITKDSYVEFYTYTPAAGFYYVNAKYGYATEGTDNFTMTITNVATSTVEVNAANYKINGSEKYPIANALTMGWKKIRIDYPSTPVSGSFRCQGMKFAVLDYDTTPLTGTATLRLNQSQATFNNCSYEDKGGTQAVASIKGTTPYADNYYINNTNETAYYDLYTNISYYKKGGTIKVTVTDVATGSEEATGTSADITATGVIHFALDNSITAGIKKVRFDFINASVTDDYLYNISSVSFYKRSLNDAYDYTPVAADGVDVVLTRSIPADKWATLCLPFSMDNATLKATYGDDVKIANFTAYNSSTKELTFTQMVNGTDAITANTPCLIKVLTAVGTAKTINGVNIVTTGNQYVNQDGVRFQGVYASTKMAAGDYFVSGGNLYKASSSTKNIKPFRAYFTGVEAGARMAVDDGFGDVTYIEMPHVNGSAADGKCYNLQGQRVEQPTKGLYIVNGKKVIVK